MTEFKSWREYYYKHGPWKTKRCRGCQKETTSIPLDWAWHHKLCLDCYNKHKKERLALWKHRNLDRWREIQNYYRRQKWLNDPEFRRKEYLRWQEWVIKNLEGRRQIALASYYRNKAGDDRE